MAHYTIQKYMNPSGTFYLSHRSSSGPASMGGHHFHNNYEIFYLLSGERMYFIKDRNYYVTKGNVVFIKPFDLHTTQDTTGTPDHERILIKFNREFILNGAYDMESFDLLFDKYNYVSFNPLFQNAIDNIFQQLLEECQKKTFDFEAALRLLLTQLLIYAARSAAENSSDNPKHFSHTHARISAVVQYINQNYAERMSLEGIAKHFHFSPYYLSRIFKEITGFTFVEYLSNLRVTQAQKRLRDSEDSVVSIASQVGFGNQSHFGRIFKSISGITPLQYRKQLAITSLPMTVKQGRTCFHEIDPPASAAATHPASSR